MDSFRKYGKVLWYLFIMIGFQSAHSQNFFATLFAGSGNYSGDLQEKSFTFKQSHPALGLGLVFELNEKMAIRGDFTLGKISASDQLGSKNKDRNLSFYSNIYEYSLGFEYCLLNLYQYKVSPYFFTGISVFDFDPYTRDMNGNPVMLAELSTEGEGFYPGRPDYKLRQAAIPFGGGIQWAISDNMRIGLVLGYRKTFTDYIDDVSTTYIDQLLLASNRGQKAADIAYRGDELPNGRPYPAAGTQRGSPKSKDSYYFAGFVLRIRLNPKRREWEFRYNPGKRQRSKTDCPKWF